MLQGKRKPRIKRASGQSKVKIAEVTISVVTFFAARSIHKNASKPLQRLRLRPKSQNYQKAKKDTIWYLFRQNR